MEVKMQTSFIPKRPIVESPTRGSGISLFLLLAIIVFIVSIAMAVGVWLWQQSLTQKIEKDITDLDAAKKSYVDGSIEDLIRFNDRIEVSKTLLTNHLAVSHVFTLLEKNILRNIRLKTLKLSTGNASTGLAGAGTKEIKIDLSGTAVDYDALSKQSDVLGTGEIRDFVLHPVVSDFNPTVEGGVAFNFSAAINPALLSYEKGLPATQ